MYGQHRQSKVEGEQPKDTALAAVLISWFAAQVIYRGWGLLRLPSWDGLARRNTQSCGNMTDVPLIIHQPSRGHCGFSPVCWQRSRDQLGGRCRCSDEGMWARWGVEEVVVVEGGGWTRERQEEEDMKDCDAAVQGQGDSSPQLI